MTETFQLRRTKGWRKPKGGVVVARPSRWSNPFPVGTYADQAQAAELFEHWLATGEVPPPWLFTAESVEDRRQFILDHVHELAGKKLGCWCDQTGPCHAKVLARMADEAVARD